VTTAVGIGAALSQSIAGGIVHAFGYRAGFLFLSAMALAALAILYFFMPETQERQNRQDDRAIGGEPSHA
jgi:predicted MFS family arabinose efflux permease